MNTNGNASTDGNYIAFVACATRTSSLNASEGKSHSRKRTCQPKISSNCIFVHSTQLDRRGKALVSKKSPSEQQRGHLLQNGRTESFPTYNCHLECCVSVLPGDKVSLLESWKRWEVVVWKLIFGTNKVARSQSRVCQTGEVSSRVSQGRVCQTGEVSSRVSQCRVCQTGEVSKFKHAESLTRKA